MSSCALHGGSDAGRVGHSGEAHGSSSLDLGCFMSRQEVSSMVGRLVGIACREDSLLTYWQLTLIL